MAFPGGGGDQPEDPGRGPGGGITDLILSFIGDGKVWSIAKSKTASDAAGWQESADKAWQSVEEWEKWLEEHGLGDTKMGDGVLNDLIGIAESMDTAAAAVTDIANDPPQQAYDMRVDLPSRSGARRSRPSRPMSCLKEARQRAAGVAANLEAVLNAMERGIAAENAGDSEWAAIHRRYLIQALPDAYRERGVFEECIRDAVTGLLKKLPTSTAK